jgi:membrane protease subunit HflC
MKATSITLIIVVLVALIVISSAAYTVDEREQVIITQWGKPVGDPITEPGLKFKMPFIQEVTRFEKRLIEWDGDAEQIPTKDKKFIWVDSTARWRIQNALEFFKSVKDERGAQTRIDDIVDGATRAIVSSLDLIESVRTTNREFAVGDDQSLTSEMDVAVFQIEVGRHEIGLMIKQRCAPQLEPFGIELVDVRLRRINYVQEVRRKVYDRMISERKRMAEFYRSEGLGEQAKIEGQREKELRTIESEAYRQAEEIKGKADAEATGIYADSYGADPEFYAFLKMLESYEAALAGDVNLVISTDSFFFSLLKDPGEIEEGK